MQDNAAFQDNKAFSMIEGLVYRKSRLQTEVTKLLVDITFAAYKYMLKNHRNGCKDVDIFYSKLDERLERISVKRKIGSEGTWGIYENKEIILKADILL